MKPENTNDPKVELLKSLGNLVTIQDFKAIFERILEVLAEGKKGLDTHITTSVDKAVSDIQEKFSQLEKDSAGKNTTLSDELKKDIQEQLSELRDILGDALGAVDFARGLKAPEVDYSKVADIARETVVPLFPKQIEQIKETPESIRDALESLESPEKLGIDAIEGLPEELKKLQKKGGGDNFYGSNGILQVRAGTNITVDNTNPQYPIIASTGGGGGAVDSVNGQTGVVVLDADDIDDTSTTNKFATASEKTKLSNISVTQSVNLDTIESDTATNNAKVTNATHTGEVTGATALTVDKTAISNRTDTVITASDYIIFGDVSDSDNLKKDTVQGILDLVTGGVSDGDKGDITVSGSGATWTIDNGVVSLAKQADVATSTVFYRKTAGTGAPEVQTLATLKTDLGLTGTNSGDVTVTDSSEIDFTLAGQNITASIIASSIDESKLDASTNASLDLADTSVQPTSVNTLTNKTIALGSNTISGTLAEFNTALTGADFATGGGTVTGTSSGTNTGDQTSIVGITGTKAQFDTAVTDGNFLFVGDVTQYTDEMAQDAVGAMVDTTLVYTDGTPLLSRAALTGAITASAGSNATSLGSFTKAQLDTAVSDGNVLYVGDVTQYTDELAQDAVGTILTDSSEIDFTYNDGVPSITASIVAGSVDETKLDASVNASLDLADTAAQVSFRTIAVSGQSDVVADSATDTLTLVAGTNVTLTTNAGTDTITINASGSGGGGMSRGEVEMLRIGAAY